MSLYDSLQEQMNNVHIYADYFMASCPWHGRDEHPSLMVHPDGFKCLTCGKGGSLEYLAGKWNVRKQPIKVTRSQSSVLPRWRRWEQEYGDLTDIARVAHLSLKRNIIYNWYFKKRKIDQFISEGYFGYLDGWCVFPVLDTHYKVQDIVVRSAKAKQYVVSPAATHPLYVPNWTAVEEAETIYVVYGIIDSWALYDCGLPVVTGTSGKSLSAALLKPLDKRYIIVPDQYEERDAYKLAGELGWRASVLRLPYPSDCKDPDDIRRNFNVETLTNLLTVRMI